MLISLFISLVYSFLFFFSSCEKFHRPTFLFRLCTKMCDEPLEMMANKYYYRLKRDIDLKDKESFLYHKTTKERALEILNKGFEIDSDSKEKENIVHFYDSLDAFVVDEKDFIIICRLSKDLILLKLENSEENYKKFVVNYQKVSRK